MPRNDEHEVVLVRKGVRKQSSVDYKVDRNLLHSPQNTSMSKCTEERTCAAVGVKWREEALIWRCGAHCSDWTLLLWSSCLYSEQQQTTFDENMEHNWQSHRLKPATHSHPSLHPFAQLLPQAAPNHEWRAERPMRRRLEDLETVKAPDWWSVESREWGRLLITFWGPWSRQ